MFEYLASLLLFTGPLVLYGFSQKEFRGVLVKVSIVGLILGGVWDLVAVHWLKIWSFDPDKLVGVSFLGLPLEEWLFFPLVSMSVSTLALSAARTAKIMNGLES